jgi:protein-S-isoprenylcysteine O-methyltransferase Ste14
MAEEIKADNKATKIAKGYFRYIRGAARKSILYGGAIFYIFGSLVSILDFIVFQQAAYRFDFVNLVGFALIIAGLGLRVQAQRTLGKYFSPVTKVLPEHKLIKYGIYRHVRHPIYLGSLLAFFSVPLIFHSIYGLIVIALAIPFMLHRIRVEEQMLIDKFGEEYRDYIKNSKKLIPYIY